MEFLVFDFCQYKRVMGQLFSNTLNSPLILREFTTEDTIIFCPNFYTDLPFNSERIHHRKHIFFASCFCRGNVTKFPNDENGMRVQVAVAINIFSDTSMGLQNPSHCKSPTSSVKPMDGGIFLLQSRSLKSFNSYNSKHYPETRGMF